VANVVNAVKFYRQDDGAILQVPYQIEHPPDTQAASLWLRNRQPHRWRDRHEVEVADAGESLLDGMTEDQLIERVLMRRAVPQRKPS
jgi:hypothetical protein